MSYHSAKKTLALMQRESVRACRLHQKELERRMKESFKLSALEQARLEVEAHENQLAVLLSVHKEARPAFDWIATRAVLTPPKPPVSGKHQFLAHLDEILEPILGRKPDHPASEAKDRADEERSMQELSQDIVEIDRMRKLAEEILSGDSTAYLTAVEEFSNLGELSALGSSMQLSTRGPAVMECTVKVKGREAIPAQIKSLTSAGKVSTKAISKGQFHEIYQDYVCGCVLRLGRELLSLLPLETVIVTATVDSFDRTTGSSCDLAVLSVVMPRMVMEKLDFTQLDPSDSLVNFSHRGDVIASRRSGEFSAIIPFTSGDLPPSKGETLPVQELRSKISRARADLAGIRSMKSPAAPIPG
jgi:hypothetical protein